jgi:hypothetical protein
MNFEEMTLFSFIILSITKNS